MRTLTILMVLFSACDGDGTFVCICPADLSAHAQPDLSSLGGTTCFEAIKCMQTCSGHFAECAGYCAGDLTPTAQGYWDAAMACLDVKCTPVDAGPICDNFRDTSCVACAQGMCFNEIQACADH